MQPKQATPEQLVTLETKQTMNRGEHELITRLENCSELKTENKTGKQNQTNSECNSTPHSRKAHPRTIITLGWEGGHTGIIVDNRQMTGVVLAGWEVEVCTGSKLKPEPGPYPRSSDPTRPERHS